MNTAVHRPIPEDLDVLTGNIIAAAMDVHSALGPGLLESAYAICLAKELADRNIEFKTEVPLPVVYKGVKLDAGYRLDFVIGNCVILELKACESLTAVHDAQVLSYLKLSKMRVGLLINCHALRLKDGIRRFVND